MTSFRRVLLITGDPLGDKLAGPAIRAWNLARVLGARREVRLISTAAATRAGDGFDVGHVEYGDDRGMAPHLRWADVVVFQGFAYDAFPELRQGRIPIVADLYDPLHLELLEQSAGLSTAESLARIDDVVGSINAQLRNADLVICASDLQRDLWLGALGALGRINPLTYSDDPDLRNLIDVVPFGIPERPPERTGPGLRDVVRGVDGRSRILLWGGGLYDWFDPETLIRAVADVATRHAEVVLYFQGTRHPNPAVPEMAVVRRARSLAAELGVAGTHVIFNDSWVDYDARHNFLLDADIGVSTHPVHLETRFAFRTRVLDYLWAGLPIIVTEGDYFADLVAAEGLGKVVPVGDVSALADAIESTLFDDQFRIAAISAVGRVRERFTWDTVVRPLEAWLDRGERARDGSVTRRRRRHSATGDLRAAVRHLRSGGVRAVLRRVRARRLRR